MKYLTDPTYVTSMPFSLVPDTLAYITGFEFFRKLNWIEKLNKEAFSKFNGIDLNLTLAGLLRENGTKPNFKKIEKIKKRNWKIYAFHGGQEDLREQFNYMETNLAEDTNIVRKKIKAQLEVVKQLSSNPNIIVVYHPGKIIRKTKNINTTLKNLEFALKEVEGSDVMIAMENMPRCEDGYHIGSDYRDLKKILKEIDSPNLGVCFDWGHANNYAGVFAKEYKKGRPYIKNFDYQKEIIEELNEKIVYAHIHYNLNHLLMNPEEGYDDHLPLTRIPYHELDKYKETMQDLVQKTSIKKYDSMLIELTPAKVFGFYPFYPPGSTRDEIYKSIEIMKKMLKE